MSMTSFLLTRESTREFKNKELKAVTIDEIKNVISEIENKIGTDANVSFKFIENGKSTAEALENLGGYSGVMVKSPHYIALVNGTDTKDQMCGAYSMEALISKLNDLNLGTCWVTLSEVSEEDKAKALGEEAKSSKFILAIGERKPKNPFAKDTFSERKEIQDLVFEEKLGQKIDLDKLEDRGLLDLFYYIRFAPSTKNLQPWKFVLVNNEVVLYLEKDVVSKYGLADAGIVMYYFEELAAMINLNSKWEILDQEEENEFIKIAKIHL